jgi:hypothetical protein
MPETLLTPSSIKLFGRVMSSLQYADDTTTIGNNNFLQKQLALPPIPGTPFVGGTPAPAGLNPSSSAIRDARTILTAQTEALLPGMLVTGLTAAPSAQVFNPGTYIVSVTQIPADPHPPVPLPAFTKFVVSSDPLPNQAGCSMTAWTPGVSLARIYGFSFEGAFYSLPRPALFILQGLGTTLDPDHWFGGTRGFGSGTGQAGFRSDMDQSGVAAREWEFSADSSLVYWEYEKGDFSLRLDSEAGQFEQILLAPTVRAGADMADRSRSGMSVSGMSVSGMSVSGMSVSGMSVSGMSVGGPSRSGR